MTSALAISTAVPWLAAVGLGLGAGLVGWTLRTSVPKRFEEPKASIVSVALLLLCFPALIGALWVLLALGDTHVGLLAGIYAGAGLVYLADRVTRPETQSETE